MIDSWVNVFSIWFWLTIPFNFIPSIIAFHRNHYWKWVIFALNLGLGFNILGWLIPLIWAVWPNQTKVSDVVNKDIVTNKEFGDDTKSDIHVTEMLQKLADLNARKIITDQEYEEKKKKLLDKL